VVTLDAGISISWAPDPDGSYEHGRLHHEREADEFRARLDLATPAIEVLFDELESAGRRFLSPKDSDFAHRAQRASRRGGTILEVELACEPRFSEAEFRAVVERMATLVPAEAPQPEPVAAPPSTHLSPAAPAGRRPWWRFW